MRRARRLLLAASIPVALASGCGTDKITGPLSRTAYLARADSICAGTNARLLSLGVPRREEDFAPFARRAVPIFEGGLSRLRAVRAPDELAGRVSAFYSRLGRIADLIRRAGTAAESGQGTEARRLVSQAGDEADGARTQAKAIGFHICGRIPRI